MTQIAPLLPYLGHPLERTDFPFLGDRYEGKVRDVYSSRDGKRFLIATDRQSAFDISWCTIPLKGQVLNQLSTWWFTQVADVMPHHVLASPDPNVTVAKSLAMLKVEIVVRGYLTGSTGTSAWVNYAKGVRNYCGNILPEGMVKNQPFDAAIITPTTKDEHDELIDPAGIIERGFATKAQWQEISEKALALFAKGQRIAESRGLILVDTKYEMGLDSEGKLTLGDEVHTPDSSRYWIQATYAERFEKAEEPESLDKEFFRLWLREQGFDPAAGSAQVPTVKAKITDEARLSLSQKYIALYERMTGEKFVLPAEVDPIARMERNLKKYLGQ